jgi:hypothetical protein
MLQDGKRADRFFLNQTTSTNYGIYQQEQFSHHLMLLKRQKQIPIADFTKDNTSFIKDQTMVNCGTISFGSTPLVKVLYCTGLQ